MIAVGIGTCTGVRPVVIADSDRRLTISLGTSTASDHLARVWRRRVATAGKCPPRGGAGRQTVDENPDVRRLFSAAAGRDRIRHLPLLDGAGSKDIDHSRTSLWTSANYLAG